jgi:hypothetical protein
MSPSLPEALRKTADVVQALENRLGGYLFKDFLSLHFSAARPPEEVWARHPVIVVVVEHLRLARDRGEIPPDVAPLYSGLFFLVGLYALLLTLPASGPVPDQVLDQYVETSLNGMKVAAPNR